jgi:signal transduction histidine kinase
MSLSASLQTTDHRTFRKGEHQAAAVYLGQLAFSDLSAADFAAEAVSLAIQVLQVEYCLLWELQDDGQGLSLMAGAGEMPVTPSQIPLVSQSLEGQTLLSPNPIIVEKSKIDAWANPSVYMQVQGVENAASVRIGTVEKQYGLIQVFSLAGQSFSQGDIHFLQTIANTVGMVLHQGQCRQEQTISSAIQGMKSKSAIHLGFLEWDRYEVKNLLAESQEKERLRLAQELHDVPIQDLYGMIYQLDDLRDALKEQDGEKLVDECDHTLHRVVDSLRTICKELRPPSLSPFGLEVAIRDHVEKFRDQFPDIAVHLELMQDRQVLQDTMRLALFRIYQQSIQNVARHAQASEVHIRFLRDSEMVVLEVEDNGIGFEMPENWVELAQDEHFGLLGIVERVESIRGKLEIVSALGGGTRVRVTAPYS